MITSYKGCNEEIAESLKKGEHVRCMVRANTNCSWSNEIYTVIAFVFGEEYEYQLLGDDRCVHAEPVKTETRVIGHVAMMKGLIERGYVVNKAGYWVSDSAEFHYRDWVHCGTTVTEGIDCWEPWMLEQVEI